MYEVIFSAKLLGLGLKAEGGQTVVVSSTQNPTVTTGDLVISVANENVQNRPPSHIVRLVAQSKRPITFQFQRSVTTFNSVGLATEVTPATAAVGNNKRKSVRKSTTSAPECLETSGLMSGLVSVTATAAVGNNKRKSAPLSTTTAPVSSRKSVRFISDPSAMFPNGVSKLDIAWANNVQKLNRRLQQKECKKRKRDALNPNRKIQVRFIGPLDADATENATAKEANKKKDEANKRKEYDRIYRQKNSSKISAQRKNRYKSKKNKTKIVPDLVSIMIPAKKVRSQMTTEELQEKMYCPLLAPLLLSFADGTIFRAICPLNNSARLNFNSIQAMRLFCGKDKPHHNNNYVYRPHYGEVGIMQTMGYDPEDFRVLPMSQDIINFVDNILTPTILNHLGEKLADVELEFNALEYKVYLGSDMFLDKNKTRLKLKPGNKKQTRRNSSEIGFHNDFQFCVNGKQKITDSANGEMPVVTVTLFDERELTYKWKRSKTGKKFEDVPNVEITITLSDASFNILLPFDEIPQSMGDFFFKTQHSAKYKGKGLSIACVFRGVKKWSVFNKKTNLLIPDKTKTSSKISEIKKLKTTKVDKYNQKMIAQNIRNYVNNNIK